MDVSVGDIYFWVVEHKWWIAAIIPIGLAIMVMRARG